MVLRYRDEFYCLRAQESSVCGTVAKKVADSIVAVENVEIMRSLRSRYHRNVSLRKLSVLETRLNEDKTDFSF